MAAEGKKGFNPITSIPGLVWKREGEMVKVKMPSQSVASMSVDALLQMRKAIDEELQSRLDQTRKQLNELERTVKQHDFGKHQSPTRRKPRAKYVGPNGEAWTGRGLRPRWLQTLIKQGHQIEEFAVDGARHRA